MAFALKVPPNASGPTGQERHFLLAHRAIKAVRKNSLGIGWLLIALVRKRLSVCFFACSSSRAKSRSFLISTGSKTRPGSLASIPFCFNNRDCSSNSKTEHLQSVTKPMMQKTNRKTDHQKHKKQP